MCMLKAYDMFKDYRNNKKKTTPKNYQLIDISKIRND